MHVELTGRVSGMEGLALHAALILSFSPLPLLFVPSEFFGSNELCIIVDDAHPLQIVRLGRRMCIDILLT